MSKSDETNTGSFDQYTVIFTGRYRHKTGNQFCYRAMSTHPYDPQGFGMWQTSDKQIDTNEAGFAPPMGRENHLGKRIPFSKLPKDCRKLILSDYKDLWDLR